MTLREMCTPDAGRDKATVTNTCATYRPYRVVFKAWCDSNGYSYAVNKKKLANFLMFFKESKKTIKPKKAKKKKGEAADSDAELQVC